MISAETNTTSLDRFSEYVTGLRTAMKRQYDRSVNKDLSQQKSQGLFKRNVTAVLKQVYQGALQELGQLSLAGDELGSREGDAKLADLVFKPFDGIVEELIEYALQKHRTSCAMSNFPDEHNPSQEYIFEVIKQTGRDWSAFVAQLNTLLPSRA